MPVTGLVTGLQRVDNGLIQIKLPLLLNCLAIISKTFLEVS